MNDRDTGGPAFPQSAYLDGPTQEGMTLRDYFAAKVMQEAVRRGATMFDSDMPGIAAMSYRMADAMLEARK